MEDLSAQALRMAVIKAAQTDGEFRDDLLEDGAAAIKKRFGDQPLKVRVIVQKDDEVPILLPLKSEAFENALDRLVKELGDRSPTRSEFEGLVIHRAWNDDAFLGQLRKDPQNALNAMLKKYSTSLPPGATVKLYEEKPGECVIAIPPLPEDAEELSDAELEAVAGGEGITIAGLVAGAVVGAIAGKVVDELFVVSPTRGVGGSFGGGFSGGFSKGPRRLV